MIVYLFDAYRGFQEGSVYAIVCADILTQKRGSNSNAQGKTCMYVCWLQLEYSGFGRWHFLKSLSVVPLFPPLLHRLIVSANAIKLH